MTSVIQYTIILTLKKSFHHLKKSFHFYFMLFYKLGDAFTGYAVTF